MKEGIPFNETTYWIRFLLERFDIDINDPEVEQDIINCAVCIDNAYTEAST